MPAFTVNGAPSGPITVIAGQNLNVSNSSQRDAAATASGGYWYSLCALGGGSSCIDNYVPWGTMSDAPPGGAPPTAATIPIPGVAGNYALKIKVIYTGNQTAYWPDPAGTNSFGLNVVSIVPLVVNASASPSTAVVRQPVTFSCNATGGIPPYFYQWQSPISVVVGAMQPTWQTTSAIVGNVVAYCFVQDSQPSPMTNSNFATASFTGGPPISVNVTASPNPAAVNQPITFSCNASGGAPPYSYQWRLPPTSFFVVGTQQTFQTSVPNPASIQAGCTVTDSANAQVSNSTTVTVSSSGPFSLFVLEPCRVVDTRNSGGPVGGPPIQAVGTTDRVFPVTSFCGIPSDARAVSANITVTNAASSGIVSIYRGDGQPTGTNTIAFSAGRTRANNAVLQLALDGSGTFRVQNTSPGTLDIVIDFNGFFR